MAFKATLSTGENKTFLDPERADRWIRDHYATVDAKKTGKLTMYTQNVKQPVGDFKIEKCGTVEET